MKYIFANWKMYLGVAQSVALAKDIADASKAWKANDVSVGIFPTALAMAEVVSIIKKSSILVGAQNCAWAPAGAYTGAISAGMFLEAGCDFVIVGHSERRHIFGEKDSDVRKKIEAILSAGLTPIVCVGETKEEKEAGKRAYRLKKQLMSAFKGLSLNGKKAIVAYEPVWAIGTGDACAPVDADDVHGWIKQELKQYADEQIPIIYGGSVDAKNAGKYLALETADGLLVGGASTKKESFFDIVKAAL